MRKHLLLVGGGHAHMVALANLHRFIQRGHRVSVIGPSEYHYYSGMGPGMLGKTYKPEDIRFATRHVVEKQGGVFILGSALCADPERKTVTLESGGSVSYDAVSFNVGSHVPRSRVVGDGGDIYPVKPIERLMEAQARILSLTSRGKITVGVVGGGPSSAEIAGNTWQLAKQSGNTMPNIQIFAGNRFMARFPEKVRGRIARLLADRGVEILETGYVKEITPHRIALESGESHAVDFVFLALGVKPSSIFAESGLPIGPDGGLLVNEFLQSPAHPDIFGGGDCIYFQKQPLDKVGVYAVRQNPVLFQNLLASLEGNPLRPFDPGGDYLLIFNLGGGVGVLRKRWLQFGGKPAFRIKDYIDRRFMKTFQAIE